VIIVASFQIEGNLGTMSLVVPPNFQHILRVLNTNIEGKTSVMFALTSIKGIGRRYANIVLKKADIPMTKRAGELTEEDTEKLITIMQVGIKPPLDIFDCFNHQFPPRTRGSTRSPTGSLTGSGISRTARPTR
jgi:hypothetical protein